MLIRLIKIAVKNMLHLIQVRIHLAAHQFDTTDLYRMLGDIVYVLE